MTPPPPRSTLFPYTTLFRSLVHDRANQRGEGVVVGRSHLHLAGARDQARHVGDRKSTRLNSSHVSISYAVFCLKKKIHNIIILSHHLSTNIPTYLFRLTL